jgi:hypothetical protein
MAGFTVYWLTSDITSATRRLVTGRSREKDLEDEDDEGLSVVGTAPEALGIFALQ